MSGTGEEQVDLEVDVVVLGAGPAGENVAGRVQAGGLSSVVVENELYGGECSFWACMPSKALLRPVEVAAAASRLPGLDVGPVDAAAVLKRRDWFTGYDGHTHDDSGQVKWIEGIGSRALRGRARLDGPRRVLVETSDGGRAAITARQAVVIAVGSDAAVPPCRAWRRHAPGPAARPPAPRRCRSGSWCSGRGVACEMAQAYRGLGAREVTIVERATAARPHRALRGGVARALLRRRGHRRAHGAQVTRVERPQAGGEVTLYLGDGSSLEADEILVATGRGPRTGISASSPSAWSRADRGRRPAASGRHRRRLAVRRRRRQRPRPAHPHGQVPGAHRGRRDRGRARGEQPARRRAPRADAGRSLGRLHRPPGRRGGTHRGRRRARPGLACGPSSTTWARSRAPRCSRRLTGRAAGGRRGPRVLVGATFAGHDVASCCTPRRSRSSARCRSTALARRPVLPDGERGVAAAAGGVRALSPLTGAGGLRRG